MIDTATLSTAGMRIKKTTREEVKATHTDSLKYELDKLYVRAKTRYVDTREQTAKLRLAKERDILIEKDLAVRQLTFLFVTMRHKMLAAPLGVWFSP
jgi:hypothetical protein